MARWIEESERNTSCSRCHAQIPAGSRFYYLRRGTYLCELCGSIAEHEQPEVGEIESGVLEDLAVLPEEASKGTIAKMMIAMARRIDNGDVADRDVAPITKEIRQMYSQLKIDFPPQPEDDETEKRRKRRERLLMIDGDLYE
jgi:hypothetical protein